MVYLAIILCMGGLMLRPVMRVYVASKRRDPSSKWNDEDYRRKMTWIVSGIRIAMCLVGLGILYWLEKGAEG